MNLVFFACVGICSVKIGYMCRGRGRVRLYSVNEWGYGWSLGDKIWGFVGDVGV